jgi:netrin receptor unc-5
MDLSQIGSACSPCLPIQHYQHHPASPKSTSTPIPPAASFTQDPKVTTWATVGNAGARLSVPESNVALTIPPGALSPNQTADIFLSVVHGVQHPTLKTRDTLLSPLVVCGPRESSVKLKKPVIVSVPHCASLRHGGWSVSLLQNDGPSENGWEKVVVLGQETINTPVYAQLDLSICHVISDHLTAFALTGESAKNGRAKKSLRLAAFAQEGLPGTDVTVRVYCLPDTDDALAYATEAERRYNGRLLGEPIVVLMQDGGDNLTFAVEALNPAWVCQKGADYLEVPFYHVWNSCNPCLHCSFTFRSRERAGGNSRLTLTLGVQQQHSLSESKSLLKINCDLRHPSPPGSSTESHCGGDQQLTSCQFRLSQGMICTLSTLLDPPNQQGNDWRLLAERLNVHRYVTFFATRPSPTEAILHLWESRSRELLAVSNLVNVLRGMGRFDVANVLERECEAR